jgi:S1-C subfamily serine protease
VTLDESVYAVGTITRGVVATVQRVIGGQPYIQSDVAITHGNSGGPLLDEKGAIAGLSVRILWGGRRAAEHQLLRSHRRDVEGAGDPAPRVG